MGKPPLSPFVLQVLTSEYLIEGTAPGDTLFSFPLPGQIGIPIPLTSVQIQATRSVEVPARTCNQYILLRINALAFVPQMDFTQIPQYSIWKQYKNSITGMFHLGHYWMTGKLMTMSPGFLKNESPVFDVRFGSQITGMHWSEFTAPFALVNCSWIHGWEPG
jgi:hypothetical protein